MSADTAPAASPPTLLPFHLAFPVRDLEATRRFFVDLLGCREGRSAPRWVDFDFHGHQISAHLRDGAEHVAASNAVDGHQVPVPHFGLVLEWGVWQGLAERLRRAEVPFIIEPYVRFEGEPGEQGTFFVRDPSGNVLEFKTFRDPASLFAT
ncbi:MAG: VOC family protein [Acidobacteriota bacterium]